MTSQRITKAIDIFLDALNNGTLAKGTPCGCAIGNLIASEINYKIQLETLESRKHHLEPNGKWWSFDECKIILDSPLLKKLDFSVKEICEIERTFENASNISFDDYEYYPPSEIRADQIKGLAAVIDVMLSFEESTEKASEVFTPLAELIPINCN